MELPKKIASEEQLKNAASQENWDELYIILIAHSVDRLKFRYRIKKKDEELKEIAKEKLSEVFSLVFDEGSRKWNLNAYSTLTDFLVSVIDSHLNNFLNKPVKVEQPVEILPEKSEKKSPEDILAYDESRKEAYDFLVENDASDEELLIFECMADGLVKPREIREDLGMSKTDFQNAWMRLKPKLLKLSNNISNG